MVNRLTHTVNSYAHVQHNIIYDININITYKRSAY